MDEYYKISSISNKTTIIPNGQEAEFVKYTKKLYGWMLSEYEIEFWFNKKVDYNGNYFNLNTFSLHHSIENYGIVVSNEKYKVVYVPDFVVDSSPELKNVLVQADLAIFSIAGSARLKSDADQYKFSIARDIARLANECGVKSIWGFHLFFQDDQDAVVQEMSDHFNGSFAIPSPGQLYTLSD